ncbi:MAG: glycosyltransferase family 4 protein [Ruminococcaceae bacterium]|nr:glycosyltransferase family 4 protein [Oscillospiraceae bacterium]
MHIIFLSATCARADYETICKKRKYPLLDSSQKFFEMFLGGLAHTQDVTVDCVTLRPISRGTYPGFYIPGSQTRQEKLCYHYVPVWNFPVLKSLMGTAAIRKSVRKLLQKYKGEEIRIICDPLLLEGLLPAVSLGKRYSVMTAGFLTDMPEFADECDEHGFIKGLLYRFYNRKTQRALKKLDRHIVLTEAMSCVAGEKPWLLLDCIVDETMLQGLEPESHEDGLPHILYAGKLHREFGLDILAEAIPLVKTPCIFDIYGDGNYKETLSNLAGEQGNVKLHGIVPLQQVLKAELGASVLINPRTSEGEFTKYSFPSKTAEYMLSGVPVVMFRLPGISQSYERYICFAEHETPESFAERIDGVLSLPAAQRQKIGAVARDYVTENKNNRHQAARVVAFLSNNEEMK